MEIKFEVRMTQKIMYNFMMNHSYRSTAGMFGTLFGISAFVILAVTYGKVEPWMSTLYLVFGVWFLLYLPLNLYVRAGRQVKTNPTFKQPITYVVSEHGISTQQGDQRAEIKWEDMWKVTETRLSLLVYTGKRYSFVLPKESMGNQYGAVTAIIKRSMDAKKVKMK